MGTIDNISYFESRPTLSFPVRYHGDCPNGVDCAFNRFLRKRIISQFSKDHLPFQAEHYQQLRAVFCEKLQYDTKKRCNTDKIKELIAEKEHNISYIPLSCSQATALEESDRIVAKQQTSPKSLVLLTND